MVLGWVKVSQFSAWKTKISGGIFDVLEAVDFKNVIGIFNQKHTQKEKNHTFAQKS